MTRQVPEDGTLLPLMEEFYTIQGEGYHTGKAAYFIRLGGCDVGCHWCDVKESWDAELHPLTAADTIIEHAKQHPSKAVVVTGGEPLLYNLDYLTQGLQSAGIKTFIETSGAYPLSGYWDWVCLSPKKFKRPLPDVLAAAGELKVIVFNKSDFDWAEQHAALVHTTCRLYLQPEWSKTHEMTPLIVDYVMQNPKWEISLQTHKYLNIP
ncbi:7-carboxy-7-deazaguanine synthase [Parapedobacter pyrenivorans]|uniref:7-carboxy-7-deazaguanine synthase n=1 Tax=Parapedobacter pyrenivorans TaxID=1305674 RepID=A0A917HZP8_9SPHI|nr:7-carboxy-7-deazaguanine synthase QueE [Parapedobacter pyrenivorans]GGG98126.1 7-carboxy-7-deazaguanine synthase [Parapedobacter pyrenivorans]